MTNVYSYYGTIASASTATTATLAPRYNYLTVSNLGSGGAAPSTDVVIWIRTDGTAAVKEADYNFAVYPGQTLLVANMAPLWYQSATVIPESSLLGNGPLTGTPYETGDPYGGSLWGQKATPGTSVSVILDSGSTSTLFVVQAAG